MIYDIYNFTNVNPGLINPKRLFNWKGTMTKYQIIIMIIPKKQWCINPGLTLY